MTTTFGSVGFAIADFSVLRFLHDSTAGTEPQTFIDLVAAPDGPKDLFSRCTRVSRSGDDLVVNVFVSSRETGMSRLNKPTTSRR